MLGANALSRFELFLEGFALEIVAVDQDSSDDSGTYVETARRHRVVKPDGLAMIECLVSVRKPELVNPAIIVDSP